MPTLNLYQSHLVADLLAKRVESLNLTSMYVMLTTERISEGRDRVPMVKLAIDYDDADGIWLSAAEREQKVNEFLEQFPDVTVTRENDYGGAPNMKIHGVTHLGVHWEIDFHAGTCERVQVGTKKVERVDPAAYAALPRVEVEEPVFEYRCPDPIVAAGLVSS